MLNIENTNLFKALEKVSYRHSSYSTCFSDFLDIVINYFLTLPNAELIKNYQVQYKDDFKYFELMFKDLLKLHQENCDNNFNKETNTGWCDILGNLYETISSKYKQSAMGQYFTPETMCTFLAMILEPSGPGKYISEPCSGSGRMILAANSVCLGNFYSCVDLDPICTKMTAFNMMIHGLQGQANCGNALWITNNWNFGYEINSTLYTYGSPSIRLITKDQSWEVRNFDKNFGKKDQAVIPNFPEIKLEPILNSQQLTLF